MVTSLVIQGKTHHGVFLSRPNRFLAMVRLDNQVLPTFLPDPGRLWELLSPGREVILREIQPKRHRKTKYDLIGVVQDEGVVSVDTRVPNRLVHEALTRGALDEFADYHTIRSEHQYARSRFDFFLAADDERCLLEVKSCTLVVDGVALFPDAPTERGRRHLRTLIQAKGEGYRTCMLFVIQRNDARRFSPNDKTDPQFGETLRRAASEGVEIYAYASTFNEYEYRLTGRVEIELC